MSAPPPSPPSSTGAPASERRLRAHTRYCTRPPDPSTATGPPWSFCLRPLLPSLLHSRADRAPTKLQGWDMDSMDSLGLALPPKGSKASKKEGPSSEAPEDEVVEEIEREAEGQPEGAADPDFMPGPADAALLRAMLGGQANLRADLVNLLNQRMNALVGASSGYVESLPKKVRNRLRALQKLQEERDELHEQYEEELRALRHKYEGLYAPLYAQRRSIVTGEVEPDYIAPEEAGGEEEGEGEAAEEEEEGEEEDAAAVGVPDFWCNALRNHDVLADVITEADADVLAYLQDVTCEDLGAATKAQQTEAATDAGAEKDGDEDEESPVGFRLNFVFGANPFFTNAVLSKSYHMASAEELAPILERAEGTLIMWQPGKNYTSKVMRKKSKKTGRAISKVEKVPSFFHFFDPPAVPEGELEDGEAEELQQAMEADYEIGSTIRDHIIPSAVDWFTGDALAGYEEEEEDDEDDDDDDEDDDDDDDDDDEEEDDDDDEDGADEGSAVPQGKVRPPGGEQPPECKQQ
eukprot:scaffold3426_cov355-Prasinococcus_capsulatus_cf.AAC.5